MTQKHVSRHCFIEYTLQWVPARSGHELPSQSGHSMTQKHVSRHCFIEYTLQWVPARSGHGPPSQSGHPMTQNDAPGACLNPGPTMHKAALPLVCGGFVACLGGPIGIWGYAGYLWIGGAIPWARFAGGLRGVNRHKAALPLVCGGLVVCLGAPSGLATGNCLPWLCGARFHFLY